METMEILLRQRKNHGILCYWETLLRQRQNQGILCNSKSWNIRLLGKIVETKAKSGNTMQFKIMEY